MEPFLYTVAQDLWRRRRDDLHRLTLVLPTIRAEYYFYRYLSQVSRSAVLAPRVTTFNKLAEDLSGAVVADNVELVCRLHKVYREALAGADDLDRFFAWGQTIVSDFDDIDAALADAAQLFDNILEQRRIDELFADEENDALARDFWKTVVAPPSTELKRRFRKYWQMMLPLYQAYGRHLADAGVAYRGMALRLACARLESGAAAVGERGCVFAGFDTLNAAQRRIARLLKGRGQAEFYWDYDVATLGPGYEAGRAVSADLAEFPPPLPAEAFDNLRRRRRMTVDHAPGAAAVARLVADRVEEAAAASSAGDMTAVIVASPDLLVPTLRALAGKQGANVTMGWPARWSQAATYASGLLDLVREARHADGADRVRAADLRRLAAHPWVPQADRDALAASCGQGYYIPAGECARLPYLGGIAVGPATDATLLAATALRARLDERAALPAEGKSADDQIEEEILFALSGKCRRLHELLDRLAPGEARLTRLRLAYNLINSVSVAFEGSPTSRLQVMDLETSRCLDFSHVVVAGANEGKLPRTPPAESNIPPSMRRHYGLPVADDHVNRQAYLMYRLAQRARSLAFVANSDDQETDNIELSRFARQLAMEQPGWDAEPPRSHSFEIKMSRRQPLRFPFDDLARERLAPYTAQNGRKVLTPSAINTYIDCPLKFYFKYVAQVREPQDRGDNLDSRNFGNLVHHAMESLYKPYVGREITAPDIDGMLRGSLVDDELRRVCAADLGYDPAKGQNAIYIDIAARYVRQILRIDRSSAPVLLLGVEERISADFPFQPPGGQPLVASLGGIVDRLDQVGRQLRVLDYKTSAPQTVVDADLGNLFDAACATRRKEALQAFTYMWAVDATRRDPAAALCGGLVVTRKAVKGTYEMFRTSRGGDDAALHYADAAPHFERQMAQTLARIFDPGQTFAPAGNGKACDYCPYAAACQ